MNLNFIVVYTQDMEQAKAFYTDALGMSVVDALSSRTFVTLRAENGAMIGLQAKSASKLPPAREKGGSVELSFEVEDVDATWARWMAKGVEAVAEPIDLPFGRYCLAKDPEGHYLSAYRFAR
jgi:predicted enzyme related to lactoylglutathione lyase